MQHNGTRECNNCAEVTSVNKVAILLCFLPISAPPFPGSAPLAPHSRIQARRSVLHCSDRNFFFCTSLSLSLSGV